MKKYEIPKAELVSITADDIMNRSDETQNVFAGDPAELIPDYWGSML